MWGASNGGGFKKPEEDDWKPAYPVHRNPPEKEVKEILSSRSNILSLIRTNTSMYLLITWLLLMFSLTLRALSSVL